MANFSYMDYLKNNQYVPSMQTVRAANATNMTPSILADKTQRQLGAEGFGSLTNPSGRVVDNKTVIDVTPNAEQLEATNQARYTHANRNGNNGGGNPNATYIAQLNSLYDQIMNRKPFQYDLNGDLLYRQMADQYTQLGQQAMRDTMGQAAALTGGYGNSYAQQVGNQAYQQYLTYLNEQIPSLYDRAYGVWQDEGDRLLEQYQLAAAHPGYLAAMQPTSGGSGSTAEADTDGTAALDATSYAAILGAMGLGGATNTQMNTVATTPAANGGETVNTRPVATTLPTYDPTQNPLSTLYYLNRR